MEANRERIDDVNERLAEVDRRLFRANKAAQFAKATYDVNRYAFEEARKKDPEGVGEQQKEIEAEAQRLHELNLEVQKIEAERTALQAELGKYTSEVGRLQKELDQVNFEQNRLNRVVTNIEPSFIKDYFRNAPLLDFMAPTLTVRQVVTPNVVDDVNFARVMKMDRCTTCHLAIDRRGYEKYPQPFRTHPNLSAYVGSDSPHPLATTGCTVCHQGLGGSTSFNDASHYPSNAKQRQEWEEKYHWHEPHMWDYPMLPTNMTEASCVQCHRQEIYVPNAPKLAVAYATFERAGCYACHKTQGLREPSEARTDPDEDQRQADAGLGEELGARSVRHQERHLDAEGLVQLEQQRAGRPSAQRGGNQRGGRVPVREQRDLHAGRRVAAARRSEGGRADRALDRLSRLPHHRRERSRSRRPAPHVRPAAEERRQQDDLRVALQLGSRSEALQPRHVHARPAAHRSAGGRRRDVSDDADRAGGNSRRR